MAAPIMCNGPDGGPAAVMVTMLADGDTVGLCPPCLTDWCVAFLKATSPELLAGQPTKPKPAVRRKAAADPKLGTEDASVSGQGISLVPLAGDNGVYRDDL